MQRSARDIPLTGSGQLRAKAPTVLVAAALPPPVHGQSLVNTAVVEQLRRRAIDLTVVDTSAGLRRRGAAYHFSRALKFLRAASVLIYCRWRSNKRLYMPLEAGAGMLYNILLACVARLSGYEIILHHHSSPHALSHSPRFAVLATVCGKRAVHVALSEQMAADLVTRYRQIRQILVCTNAAHVSTGSPFRRHRRSGGPLVVGLLANLSVAKGLDIVIDAVLAARSAGERVELVLAGPAIDVEATALIARARAQLGEALRVMGPVSGRSKGDFYRRIDIFIFPTRYRYEAQPLVIYEALSFGLPILATDMGYIREMLNGVGTAFHPSNNLRQEIVKKLTDFAGDPGASATATEQSHAEFKRAAEKSAAQFSRLCSMIVGSNCQNFPLTGTNGRHGAG